MSEAQNESMLDIHLDDAQELKILNAGEHKLRITRADVVENKSNPGRNNLRICVDDSSDPLVDDIYVYLVIPEKSWKDSDPKAYVRAVNRIKDFAGSFSVEVSGTSPSRYIGQEGWCDVTEEEDNRDGTMRNQVRRFIVKR